jgi:hypothetical protein
MRAAHEGSEIVFVGFKTEAILLGLIFVERLVPMGFLAAGQSALTTRADERSAKMHRWARFSARQTLSFLVLKRPSRSRSREARAVS